MSSGKIITDKIIDYIEDGRINPNGFTAEDVNKYLPRILKDTNGAIAKKISRDHRFKKVEQNVVKRKSGWGSTTETIWKYLK